jgi:hypothetical protein
VKIYNFFPTEEQEKQIDLEKIIKQKLQAFHDALGEDAKYLSDEEIVGTYSLFGEKLYAKLNNAESYRQPILQPCPGKAVQRQDWTNQCR